MKNISCPYGVLSFCRTQSIILVLFSIFVSAEVQANTIVIGTGSGSVIKTSMGTLAAGDTLAIAAGTYSGGGQFGGLNNVTIVNYGGTVTFTAPVDLGAQGTGMSNITWTGTGAGGGAYGFVFDATGAYGAGPVGYTTNGGLIFTAQHYSQVRFDHIWFKGLVGNAFDLSGVLPTYDGTTASLGLYRATISYCRADNTSEFYQGPYKAPNFGFADSVDISYNILNQTTGNGEIVNAEMTDYNIHHNQILYSGYNTLIGDVGAFSLTGFGQIHHNYMKGGRGWLARVSGCSLKPTVSTFYGYDNIKMGSTNYGMFDLRSDSLGFFAPVSNFFQHCNFQVVNNTFGNLVSNDDYGSSGGTNGYNTPVALFYVMDGGSTGLVKNNLGFNSVPGNSGGYVCISFASSNGVGLGFSRIDTSNNAYYPASAILNVLSDTNNLCLVKAAAPIIGAGQFLSAISTDYLGKPRSDPPTIGAEDLPSSGSSVLASAGANQTVTLPLDSVALSGSGSTVTGSAITSYNWSEVSGPGTAILSFSDSVSTEVRNLLPGTYVFALKVRDANNDSSGATVTVTVNAAGQPPVVSAGADISITLPVSSVMLAGAATDLLGISSYLWSQASGPNTANIVSGSSSSTSVTGLIAGTYIFQLRALDIVGLSSIATVSVTVNPADTSQSVISVTASARPSAITIPKSTARLYAYATDPSLPDAVFSFRWAQQSGPSTAYISRSYSSYTRVSGLIAGVYVFSVTASDTNGTATATVAVTVTDTAAADSLGRTDSSQASVLTLQSAASVPKDSAALEAIAIEPDKNIKPDDVTIGLYPNPVTASTTFWIKSPTTGVVLVNIYDMSGRLLWLHSYNKPTVELSALINLQGLRPGAYLLRPIIGGKPSPAIKFIKQ